MIRSDWWRLALLALVLAVYVHCVHGADLERQRQRRQWESIHE